MAIPSMNLQRVALLIILASMAVSCSYADDEEDTVKCFAKDREALLSFKKAIKEDATGILSSWTAATDCCGSWEGVECQKGRVTTLLLQNPAQTNQSLYMVGTLSPSLAELKFLRVLIISGMKYIKGTIPASISGLNNLVQLYIENNQVRGSIPAELGRLPKLQALSLAGNRLTGAVPAALSDIKTLVQLNLAENRLTGLLPPAMAKLRGLQTLDMTGNFLYGAVPDFIGSFSNLTYLDLSRNFFTGTIPSSFLNLSAILDINLSHNRITGRIPRNIGLLASLNTLSVSNNLLEGAIPESVSNMSKLWYLNLSSNHLSNPLPSTLANTPSLISLDLSYNNFHLGRIPKWITGKEMTNLHLAACGVSQCLSTWKPHAMNSLLTSLDLSNNNLTGDITHLLKNMTSLEKVDLSNNSLTSNLSRISLPDSISRLDLHSNKIYGTVDSIFSNKISESCWASGGCLEFINLANNKISGKLPEIRGERSIKWLDLSGNRLEGTIPPSISMLKKILRLDFSGNQLAGKIPGTLGALKELRWLDLSKNGFEGKIPGQILGLKYLKHLGLSKNHLCGEIPQGRPLNLFSPSVYAHNDCLCGSPLLSCKKSML